MIQRRIQRPFGRGWIIINEDGTRLHVRADPDAWPPPTRLAAALSYANDRTREVMPTPKAEPGAGYVYFIADQHWHYKIGQSVQVRKRFHELQTAHAERLTLLGCIQTDSMDLLETYLHRLFAKYHVGGEWFRDPVDDNDVAQWHHWINQKSYFFCRESGLSDEFG